MRGAKQTRQRVSDQGLVQNAQLVQAKSAATNVKTEVVSEELRVRWINTRIKHKRIELSGQPNEHEDQTQAN